MTPFQEFRLWARRSPASERVVTAVCAIIGLGLLGWLLVPAGDDASTESVSAVAGAAETTAPTSAAVNVGNAGAGAPTAPDGSSGSAAAATNGSGAAVGPAALQTGDTSSVTEQSCVPPAGGAQGVTDSQIKIAIALGEIVGPAGNEAVGVPPAAEQRTMFEAVIDSINRGGGLACRKIVAQYFIVNPADKNQMHEQCLAIDGANAFAVLEIGAFSIDPASVQCIIQQHVPFFSGYLLSASQQQRAYPYLFPFHRLEDLYRDTALGLRDNGFYDAAKGFKKLGFIYRTCYPDAISVFRAALREAGVADSQIVTYDVGCPSGFASPADLQQAVLKFQQNGVSHVTTAAFLGDFPTFSKIAQQQGFRPKYGVPDEALIDISYGNLRPDYDNIANALTITQSRSAENRTPGMAPSAGTVKCDNVYKAHGMKRTYDLSPVAGNACDLLWMFEAAVKHAPALKQDALATGLQRAKSIDFSYPQGPNDFAAGPRVTYGGQFWRTAQFMPSCNCWQVVDRAFHPTYGRP